jgi:hypothetical protein
MCHGGQAVGGIDTNNNQSNTPKIQLATTSFVNGHALTPSTVG